MRGRIFYSFPKVILFVLIIAITASFVYWKAIEREHQHSIAESKWIDEIGSSKCGSYTKYGSTDIGLVSKELACRHTFENYVSIYCARERNRWYSIFSDSDSTEYRDCMFHLKLNF